MNIPKLHYNREQRLSTQKNIRNRAQELFIKLLPQNYLRLAFEAFKLQNLNDDDPEIVSREDILTDKIGGNNVYSRGSNRIVYLARDFKVFLLPYFFVRVVKSALAYFGFNRFL